MKELFNRAKYVLDGEEGASNLEIIVWFSVVLTVATLLFLFRDAIVKFIQGSTAEVNKFKTK